VIASTSTQKTVTQRGRWGQANSGKTASPRYSTKKKEKGEKRKKEKGSSGGEQLETMSEKQKEREKKGSVATSPATYRRTKANARQKIKKSKLVREGDKRDMYACNGFLKAGKAIRGSGGRKRGR